MPDFTAQEALRSMIAEAIQDEMDRVYGDGRQMDASAMAGAVLDKLPEIEWEFTTNEHDVPVRRLAVKGKWLVDLTVAEANAQTAGGHK